MEKKFAAAIERSLDLAPGRVKVLGFRKGSIIVDTEIQADDAAKELATLKETVKSGGIKVDGYPVNKDVAVESANAGLL